MTRVFLIGYPGNVGGACTEAWHTLRLWKEGGMDVHVIPTWGEDAVWEARLDGIGVRTHHAPYREIAGFDLLTGGVAVGMCNDQFLQVVGELRGLGCRLVWVGCMTWPFDAEPVIYERHGLFDAYVFQSNFQRELLEKELAKYGYDASRGHLIPGPFFADEWEFRPRGRDSFSAAENESRPLQLTLLSRRTRPKIFAPSSGVSPSNLRSARTSSTSSMRIVPARGEPKASVQGRIRIHMIIPKRINNPTSSKGQGMKIAPIPIRMLPTKITAKN